MTGSLEASLPVGLSHSYTMTVDERMIVPAVFPKLDIFQTMPAVFATAFMVGLMELACIDALHKHLASHQRTVGTHVDISHCAATPLGQQVTAEVTLEKVKRRLLWFDVVVRDEVEIIGEGSHQRAIVELHSFMDAVSRKAAGQA